ncbi:tRNA lysidine(34) synthetase TilS [Jiulongibacter sp. NS-SX5]|uniref:tRNA lysidine(34) synthetase TilS n=1 Tax=Jiulongibacter sp. NS-SX5 TaxID=3463854 RepID=UPI0040585DBE
MQKQFLTYLKNTIGLQEDQKVLVAVSGGVDSMVLIHLLLQSPYDFHVAHMNFQLRGEDSEGDRELVQSFCLKNSIPFYTRKVDTLRLVEKSGKSTQMIARDLRYEWFDELLKREKLDFIATAHHANDHFETALLNLARGTGTNGLKGILPIRGKRIRPLLFATKAEILSYAEREKIIWREDSSNESDKYKRNFIRHHLVPLFKEINPSVLQTFQSTAAKVAADVYYLEQSFLQFKETNLQENGTESVIEKDILDQEVNKAMAYRLFEELDFDMKTINKILTDGLSSSGLQFESPNYIVWADRDYFSLTEKKEVEKVYHVIDKPGSYSIGGHTFQFRQQDELPEQNELRDPNKAFLNFDKLKFPLVLRSWEERDRFQPFGMKGTKLVSDYLIDIKVPVYQKRHQLVLESENRIAWLVGHRIDDSFKIDVKTKSILKIDQVIIN